VEAPRVAVVAAAAPAPPPLPPRPTVQAAPPVETDPPVELVEVPELSPFDPETVARLRDIRDRSARRRDDVFMKVGDSSTVSRGFLQCLSSDRELALDGRDALRPTLEHFRHGDAGGRDPFRRVSLAAREGWSTRQVLVGRPAPLLAELRAVRPRFAFVMNGGNDVEGRDPFRYAERMRQIVLRLEEQGTIPILNSLPPRDDDLEADAMVERFNGITWALAHLRGLPYLDYHQVMRRLPRRGLAGDGVHPNIRLVEGRGRACDFTQEGLRHGHNARNLLALRALDLLRRTVVEGEGAPSEAEPPRAEGAGTPDDPRRILRLPFADRVDTREGPAGRFDRYPACHAAAREDGPERVYRLRVDRPMRLRARVFVDERETDLDLHLLGDAPRPENCVARADRRLEVDLAPGVHHVVVDTFHDGRRARAGSAMVLFEAVADR
jgi:hypothetical protein